VIRAIYPAQCVACDAQTAEEHGLCGSCWRDTHFIHGLICDTCGVPLMGGEEIVETGERVQCDDCMTIARPWDRGRAALVYDGVGRRMVLGLKHGDRTDLAVPAGGWLAQAARPLLTSETMLVPVPLHWSRLLKRRYNQAALLAGQVAKMTGAAYCPDALRRVRKTSSLDGHSREERFKALDGAIESHAGRVQLIAGRDVVLVDDVMTTGATFAACADTLLSAGAREVCVVALARVAKDT